MAPRYSIDWRTGLLVRLDDGGGGGGSAATPTYVPPGATLRLEGDTQTLTARSIVVAGSILGLPGAMFDGTLIQVAVP